MSNNDVFQVGNGVPANFHDGTIELQVNSQSKGRKTVGNLSLGAFLDQQARSYGIRTFSAYGTKHGTTSSQKLTAADTTSPAAGFSSLDIVAKDARGRHDRRFTFHIARR